MSGSIRYQGGVPIQSFGVVRPSDANVRAGMQTIDTAGRILNQATEEISRQNQEEAYQAGLTSLQRTESGEIVPPDPLNEQAIFNGRANAAFNRGMREAARLGVTAEMQGYLQTQQAAAFRAEVDAQGNVTKPAPADPVAWFNKSAEKYVNDRLAKFDPVLRASIEPQIRRDLTLAQNNVAMKLLDRQQTEAIGNILVAAEQHGRDAIAYARNGDEAATLKALDEIEKGIVAGMRINPDKFDVVKARTALAGIRRDVDVEREWRKLVPEYEKGATPFNITERAQKMEERLNNSGLDAQIVDRLRARVRDRASQETARINEANAREDEGNQTYLTSVLIRLAEARDAGESTGPIIDEVRSRLSSRASGNFIRGTWQYFTAPSATPEQRRFQADMLRSLTYDPSIPEDSEEQVIKAYEEGKGGRVGSREAMNWLNSSLNTIASRRAQRQEIDTKFFDAQATIRAHEQATQAGMPSPVAPEKLADAYQVYTDRASSTEIMTPNGRQRVRVSDPAQKNLANPMYEAAFYVALSNGVLLPEGRAQIERLLDPNPGYDPETLFKLADHTLRTLNVSGERKIYNGFEGDKPQTIELRAIATKYKQIQARTLPGGDLHGPENADRLRNVIQQVQDGLGRPVDDADAAIGRYLRGLPEDIRPLSTSGMIGFRRDVPIDQQLRQTVNAVAVNAFGNEFGSGQGIYVGGRFFETANFAESTLRDLASVGTAFGLPEGVFQFVMSGNQRPLQVNPRDAQQIAQEVRSLISRGLLAPGDTAALTNFTRARLNLDAFGPNNRHPEFANNPKVFLSSNMTVETAFRGDTEAAALAIYKHIGALQASQARNMPAGPEVPTWFGLFSKPEDLRNLIRNGQVAVEPVTQSASGIPAVHNGVARFNVMVKTKEGSQEGWVRLPGTMAVRMLTESDREAASRRVSERMAEYRERNAEMYRSIGLQNESAARRIGGAALQRAGFAAMEAVMLANELSDVALQRREEIRDARENPVTMGTPR